MAMEMAMRNEERVNVTHTTRGAHRAQSE